MTKNLNIRIIKYQNWKGAEVSPGNCFLSPDTVAGHMVVLRSCTVDLLMPGVSKPRLHFCSFNQCRKDTQRSGWKYTVIGNGLLWRCREGDFLEDHTRLWRFQVWQTFHHGMGSRRYNGAYHSTYWKRISFPEVCSWRNSIAERKNNVSVRSPTGDNRSCVSSGTWYHP